MSPSDDELAPEGHPEADGSRSHPELPPGIPGPPEIDRDDETTYLQHWGDRFAEARMPNEDTLTGQPLEPELAAEKRHEALQQRIAQWSQSARTSITARRDQSRRLVEGAADEVEAIDRQITAREEELERLDTEAAASDPARRFDDASPAVWLLAPFALAVLEYPVVHPVVGRLFDVTANAQILATVAIVIGQIVVYEATGALAQRWRASKGPLTERRTVVGATLAALTLSILFIVGLTFVRLDQLPDDRKVTALLLLVGVQAGFALLSMLSGWKATSPEATSRRTLTHEIDRLKQQRDAIQEYVAAETQQADSLDGLLTGWSTWLQRHRESTRAAYIGEIYSFRAYLKYALAKQQLTESVYCLQQIPLPAFDIPPDDGDRSRPGGPRAGAGAGPSTVDAGSPGAQGR